MSARLARRCRGFLLTACVVFLACASPAAGAGEKPAIKLTGHPSTDFFGGSFGGTLRMQSGRLSHSDPPLLPQQDQASGEEKNPWLAGLLSLAVPGAGEYYSKSYVKAAVFVAAEAASWIVAYTYNKKGDQQTGDFQAFADQHWSPVRYALWTQDNIGVLSYNTLDPASYDPVPEGHDADCHAPFPCVTWSELQKMEGALQAVPANGYTHVLPYYGAQQYYELIGKYDQFSRGWDDADLQSITQADLPLRSNSKRFYQYAEMRAQANNQYDIASTFVSVAVINHIVSAIDAYWSAKRFNSSLHADLRMRVQPTPYGVVPVTEARIEYRF